MSASKNMTMEMQDDSELRRTIKRSHLLIVLNGLLLLLFLDFLLKPISIDYRLGLHVLILVLVLSMGVYYGVTAHRAKKILKERFRSPVQGPTGA